MKFNIITSATINRATIDRILKEAIEKETGLTVVSMATILGDVGNQRDSYKELTGITVTFCPKPAGDKYASY